MQLGAFSLSLNVKNIVISKEFYSTLGFQVIGGVLDQGWLILRNGTTTIGLFQGMFEKNTLTFNPGWDHDGSTLSSYTDIRDIQKALTSEEIEFQTKADENTKGPTSFIITDPDGNPILIDQHI